MANNERPLRCAAAAEASGHTPRCPYSAGETSVPWRPSSCLQPEQRSGTRRRRSSMPSPRGRCRGAHSRRSSAPRRGRSTIRYHFGLRSSTCTRRVRSPCGSSVAEIAQRACVLDCTCENGERASTVGCLSTESQQCHPLCCELQSLDLSGIGGMPSGDDGSAEAKQKCVPSC
jgi:hypothetical protein